MRKYLKKLFCSKENSQIDVFQLKKRHYGFSHKDKIIYYINETNGALGFFAMYRYWLEYLYFADVCGYMPVIEVGKEFAYCENKIFMSTKNPFEYYFQQPSFIKIDEIIHSSNVIVSNVIHRQMVELIFTGKRSHYDCNLRYMRFMGEMVKKYLRFNSITRDYIEEGIKGLGIGDKKILGVHIRGTDFRKKYDNHPIFVTETEVFNAVESILEKNKYHKIFLATDDKHILNTFLLRYGEKICYYSDVMRSSDKKSIIFHVGERENHKYKLGREVIRDMYTLSRCNGLVAGISQVAICARINKLARKEKYQDMVIIDKGINKNGHPFLLS